VAGLWFLPREKWVARFIHRLVVVFRERFDRFQRARALANCASWVEVEGTVSAIQYDSSNPREEVLYSYATDQGYQSGSYWNWFERESVRPVRAGDRLILRYDPTHPGDSVFLKLIQVSE
jgi:hypothetical protein